jgi:hypothetical protein
MAMLGMFKIIYNKEDGLKMILIEQGRLAIFIIYLLVSLGGLWFLHYMMSFGQIEVIKFWLERNNIIKEMENIFHSLQESIITIDSDGV